MRPRLSRFFVSILLAVWLCALPIKSASAQETAAANPCLHTLSTTIMFEFPDTLPDDTVQERLQTWRFGMQTTWNKTPFFGQAQCGATYEFTLQALPAGDRCASFSDTYHCIRVVDKLLNRRGKIGDVSLSGPQSARRAYGEWTLRITDVQAAHLSGHLLGLDDGYVEQDTDGDGIREWRNLSPDVIGPWNIMARPWGNMEETTSLAAQTDLIMNSAGYVCSASCSCGNGVIDGAQGESCDPQAPQTGCGSGLSCNNSCRCVPPTPFCGDGVINGTEQCDASAPAAGCDQSFRCTDSCTCEADPDAAQPADDATDPINSKPPAQSYRHGDGICSPSENCINSYIDCKESLRCTICGNNLCENNERLSCPSDCGGEE